MSEGDFKYLSQEFDTNVLDLVKQNAFYPYEYMSDFESVKDNSQAKKSFIVPWPVKKWVINYMNMFLRFRIHFKWKRWIAITTCT